MTAPPTLTGWMAVAPEGWTHTAPELCPVVVRGSLDSRRIQTSPIASADGRTVTTASGSTYLLGDPDPDWVRWLAQQGHDFDPEHPIRIKETSA